MGQGVVARGACGAGGGLKTFPRGKYRYQDRNHDAWFIGYSPGLVAGVWVGFDTPRSLGDRESAAGVALPIWIRFMGRILFLFPNRDFPVPPGITFARVDPGTGTALPPGSSEGVLLPFRVGTVPPTTPVGRRIGPSHPSPDELL